MSFTTIFDRTAGVHCVFIVYLVPGIFPVLAKHGTTGIKTYIMFRDGEFLPFLVREGE